MTNNKLILGFVGDIAAGKGTVCKYLKEKHHTPSYRFSDMLRDVLNRVHVPISRENLQTVSSILRQTFGQDLLSKSIVGDVTGDPSDLVAVEGIRRPTDVAYLEKLPGFHLIYITADPKLRWERVVQRNENTGDAGKTFADFVRDGEAEAEQLISEFGKTAPFTIVNNSTLDELYAAVEKMLAQIKHEH